MPQGVQRGLRAVGHVDLAEYRPQPIRDGVLGLGQHFRNLPIVEALSDESEDRDLVVLQDRGRGFRVHPE